MADSFELAFGVAEPGRSGQDYQATPGKAQLWRLPVAARRPRPPVDN